MADLKERVSAIEIKLDENQKTLMRVFDAIFGNGKAGILVDIRSIKTSIEKDKCHKATWQWVVTIIVALAAVVVAIFK